MHSEHELDVVVVLMCEPPAEPDEARPVDAFNPSVGKLVSDVVTNLVLQGASSFLDISQGRMALDFPEVLVFGLSFGNGIPGDLPEIAISLETPLFAKRIPGASTEPCFFAEFIVCNGFE